MGMLFLEGSLEIIWVRALSLLRCVQNFVVPRCWSGVGIVVAGGHLIGTCERFPGASLNTYGGRDGMRKEGRKQWQSPAVPKLEHPQFSINFVPPRWYHFFHLIAAWPTQNQRVPMPRLLCEIAHSYGWLEMRLPKDTGLEPCLVAGIDFSTTPQRWKKVPKRRQLWGKQCHSNVQSNVMVVAKAMP